MIDMFNIWNLHRRSSTTLVIDLTPAEAEVIRDGTPAFIAACLHACDISIGSEFSWTVKIARQSYYSDFLHSLDWKARWDITWILEITFSYPVKFPGPARSIPFRTAALDDSAEGCDEPAATVGFALLLASFPASKQVEFAVNETIQNWKIDHEITSNVSLNWLPHVQGRTLVRLLLDAIHFPKDIDHLDALLEEWRQLGGLTNWQDILPPAN